jgi:xylulokinase
MSFLGIDVGTTTLKAAVVTDGGEVLASAYQECEVQHPEPGWAELDPHRVWNQVKRLVSTVARQAGRDPVRAVAVSSLGEAVVPVGSDRTILGPSILNFDVRGEEYLQSLTHLVPDLQLYGMNGNTLGNHYGLTKLLWMKDHRPETYERAEWLLPWGSFIGTMLGGEAVVDYSLANRILLFDLERRDWSDRMIHLAGLDRSKLPVPKPSGTAIGTLSGALAMELGLPTAAIIVNGAHDQCASAVGCGVVEEGHAVSGMGTFTCVTPVFRKRRKPSRMVRLGLNTEHHALPDRYVCFVYNQGGAWVRWFRDTFAGAEWNEASRAGRDIYQELFSELPDGPSPVQLVPHLHPGRLMTGFAPPPLGVLAGIRPDTSRGEILKGILEGITMDLRGGLEGATAVGIRVEQLHAVGGGSRSDAWVQLCADVLDLPLARPRVREAATMGAAIIAGAGCGTFPTLEQGVQAMVQPGRAFEPQASRRQVVAGRYEQYRDTYARWRTWGQGG